MLPNNLKYMNKVESAPARQYTSTVQPLNGTGNYGPNTKCIINIPTSPNTVLVPSESFIKFDIGGITNGAGANNYIRLDKCGAHGVIQRLRVNHGSTQIEDTDDYGALVSQMMALQQTSDSFYGKQNILAGTSAVSFGNATSAEVYSDVLIGERLGIAPGVTLAAVGANAVLPNRTYALNLLSYIGSLSGSQYIPLFEMTAAPLTLEIQFVSSALKFLNCAVALAGNPINTYTISNIEFVGTFIELSDESITIIKESRGGQPLQYVTQSYANIQYSTTLANAITSVSIPVAAKYASLKSLFCIIRSTADGVLTYFPYSSHAFNLTDWRIRIGSQYLPAKAPNSIPEHYCELLKAIGSMSDLNHEPSINYYNYGVDQVPVANTETATAIVTSTRSGAFALGFDVETYSNSNKDKIFAGMNTLNSDIFWNLNFAANASNPVVKFDIFALYDQVIMFENGMVRVVK
jgi:hypothetical protein